MSQHRYDSLLCCVKLHDACKIQKRNDYSKIYCWKDPYVCILPNLLLLFLLMYSMLISLSNKMFRSFESFIQSKFVAADLVYVFIRVDFFFFGVKLLLFLAECWWIGLYRNGGKKQGAIEFCWLCLLVLGTFFPFLFYFFGLWCVNSCLPSSLYFVCFLILLRSPCCAWIQ